MLSMFCQPLFVQWYRLVSSGAGANEIETAWKAYEACMEQYAPSAAHAVVMQMEMLNDCIRSGGTLWECLGLITSKPFPEICPERTNQVRQIIFEDKEKALAISDSLKNAFTKVGVAFEDNETFVCTIAVAKKPRYVSSVISSDVQISQNRSDTQISCIMRPSVMKPVMKVIERDMIK